MDSLGRNDSGVTDEDSTVVVDQEETSSMENVEWTNEKHSLYLKSMEASFVDQLYNLKDMFSWSPVTEHRFNTKSCRQGNPSGSGQFKVQQHCHWPNRSRKTGAPQHASKFRAGGSHDVTSDTDVFEHHTVALKCDEEGSAQNFVDEVHENKASSGLRSKRLRTLDASTAVNDDQVVPFRILVLPIEAHNEGCSNMQTTKFEGAF